VQELIKQLAELAVDDGDTDVDPWRIEADPDIIVVSATTRDGYRDEEAAWEAAQRLWRAVLDLGYELTDGGPSQLGTVWGLDQDSGGPHWRGSVRILLKPQRVAAATDRRALAT
jgi:hypothetical protein